MKYLILASFLCSGFAFASTYEVRRSINNSAVVATDQAISDLRRIEHDQAQISHVKKFSRAHGGATIRNISRNDGATFGAGHYGFTASMIEVIDFDTKDGLACRWEFGNVVMLCFDSSSRQVNFKVGDPPNIIERIRLKNRKRSI